MSRLVVDTMLGRLATYLRMCGHDTVYTLEEGIEDDDTILEHARDGDRTILTRDRELAARGDDAILLESRDITRMLAELHAAGFELELPETPRRCSRCNGLLTDVDPESRTPGYAPDPTETDVWRCRDCDQKFWKGSHWDDVRERLSKSKTRSE